MIKKAKVGVGGGREGKNNYNPSLDVWVPPNTYTGCLYILVHLVKRWGGGGRREWAGEQLYINLRTYAAALFVHHIYLAIRQGFPISRMTTNNFNNQSYKISL